MKKTILFFLFYFYIFSNSFAQLHIVSPNGGEVLKPGSTFLIQWAGVPASEKIDLDYSTDDGTAWTSITKKALGLQYSWVVPSPLSMRCLLRASLPGRIFSDSVLADGVRRGGAGTFIWNRQSTALGVGSINEIIDAKDLHTIFKYSLNNSTTVSFSPDGGLALFPKSSFVLDIVDLKTSQILKELNGDFSSGTRWPINDPNFYSMSYTIVRWDGTTFTPLDAMKMTTWSYFMNYDVHPLSNRLALIFADDKIPYGIVFDLTTGDSLFTMDNGERNDGVGISPDGTLVASLGAKGTVKIWDAIKGSLVQTFHTPNITNQRILWQWAPDSWHIAIATNGDSVLIWDARTAILTQTLHSNTFQPYDIGFHPVDGKWLAESSFGHLFVFDPATGILLQDFDFNRPTIGGPGFIADGAMVWSPDGTKIAVIDPYGRIGILFVDPRAGEQAISDNKWTISNINPKHFSLRIGSDSAYAGDKVDLPVILTDPATAISQGADSVTGTYHCNATLLEPLAPTSPGSIVSGLRTTSFTMPVTSSTDSILGYLHFRAGLGNALSTAMHIDSSFSNSPNAILDNQDGKFTLLGICLQGGKRLLNPNGTATLILPKNFTDGSSITANVTTCEKGITKLSLIDMLGRTMKIFLDDEIPTGEHSMQLDLKDIANGKYFVILQTATREIMQTLEVTR